jgi:alpha-L-rhamnosidase
VRAVLHWTALGLAEVHLNGRRIGDEVMVPGWSDFRFRVQVMTADVTSLVRKGENVLGAVLGDGWYCGTLGWEGRRNHYGTEPRFLAALEIDHPDGTRTRVTTGKNWRVACGPILEADIYHGESYDARRELPGWCEPGGIRPSGGWQPAKVFPGYKGLLQPKIHEPVRVTETLKPVLVSPRAGGGVVFDFGQNFVGVCRLKIEAPAGTEVVLRFAEMLNEDGSLYLDNLRKARSTDRYICRGGGVEEWTPRFTFHGFRYAEVTGAGDDLPPDTLLGLVWHSGMRPTGSFECCHPDINQLHRNIRWGMRGNFLEVPTDCPQRNERLGWTGDAQVFIGTAAFHYDVAKFFRKWMFDLTDGQTADGAFPDVAPDILRNPRLTGNAAWGDAGVICPWIIYWNYGDRGILAENYDAMAAWIRYQEKTSNKLCRPPSFEGDWLAIDAVTPERAPVPSDLIGTAYFAHTTGLMTRIAAVLGRDADAARFADLRKRINLAFRKEYVSPNGRVVGDCQTGYLLALGFDLLPSALRPVALGHLLRLIEERGDHLTTGFVGTPLLCPVLSRFGRTDVAYRLLLQDTYPSWLYPIRNGATTMWERWNSYTREHGFGDANMNSFNHYAYGAIGEWIYTVVGGIRSLAPGFKKILFAPEPGGGLEHAETSLETPQGRAACCWQLRGRRLSIEVTVPTGATAQLQVPAVFRLDGKSPAILSAGNHAFVARRERPAKA